MSIYHPNDTDFAVSTFTMLTRSVAMPEQRNNIQPRRHRWVIVMDCLHVIDTDQPIVYHLDINVTGRKECITLSI
jgi:hypothetical protein